MYWRNLRHRDICRPASFGLVIVDGKLIKLSVNVSTLVIGCYYLTSLETNDPKKGTNSAPYSANNMPG
jgi:hypothetical protein